MGAGAGFPVDRVFNTNIKMLPTATVLPLDGRGASFFNYRQQVRLWRQVTNLGPAKRAPALISQMDVGALQLCMAAGSEAIMGGDGADKILTILREHPAPAAAGSVNREVALFLQFERADQAMDVRQTEFYLLRSKAVSKLLMGGAFAEASVSVLCVKNAALSPYRDRMPPYRNRPARR